MIDTIAEMVQKIEEADPGADLPDYVHSVIDSLQHLNLIDSELADFLTRTGYDLEMAEWHCGYVARENYDAVLAYALQD